MKVLHCQEAGFNCAGIIRAHSDHEVLTLAAQHAELVHQVQLTPAMLEQLTGMIRDEPN
ncbi:DUF1059 domain-containing protein [Spirosoma sp. KNUC1025]|uniref:DUF1059 domain-containing protein n=1 Tax=Spirosoma sp. KNUC1025 TaxID=2894082 RepID=UPI001E5D8F4D|nr:DUF1059 domain-containing protein [Spirosoma sp. KNUC1025]UFH57620.1 DUF1059 domain-containing protein [Spirosoma sp. KNUC1025]